MTTDPDGSAAYAHDSAMALLAMQVSRAIEASHREIDAPAYPTEAERVAWADGYTKACEDIRTAIRGATDE